MKPPRFDSPNRIPDSADLPAVATTRVQGFLSECAAVARFGPTATAEPYLLLSYEQRSTIRRAVPGFAELHMRLPGDFDKSAVLRPNGNTGAWFNGESLWVAVSWLLWVEPLATDSTYGSAMLFSLARQCKQKK